MPKGNPHPKPGPGRPEGLRNKRTLELRKRLEEKFPDFCPIERLCAFAMDEEVEKKDQAWACKEVAPYIYPKLKNMEVAGMGDNGEIVIKVINKVLDTTKK